MSFYAYTNEKRNITNKIYAKDVTMNNKLNEYFCPTENCAGKMYVRAIENSERKTHFVIKTGCSHSDFCRIGKERFSPTEYTEELFDYNEFMQNILKPQVISNNNVKQNPGGDGNIKPISTVKQLYLQCINMDINQFYNGYKISDILIDYRTRHIYKYYIKGFHLVECYCYRYNLDERKYYAKYWLDESKSKYHILELKFTNDDLFKKQKDRGYFQKNIVVAGIWENDEKNIISTTINRNGQIYKNI